MLDAEIEAEISQIELTNMLTAELRKRYPETYRLARRISTLIQTARHSNDLTTSAILKLTAVSPTGFTAWPSGRTKRSRRDVQEMDERVKVVSFLRPRHANGRLHRRCSDRDQQP